MTNQEVLDALSRYATTRREKGAFILHGPYDGYLRVNGGGYRAVCVDPKLPLCQFAAGGADDLDEVLAHFQNRPREISSLNEHPRPERELQAHLIREALQHRGDLLFALGPGLPFDQLQFAVDEVRLDDGKIRCDMLAVGVRDGIASPVLIELKYGRHLTELIHQLRAFERLVRQHKAAFEKLLSSATGESVSMQSLHFMIVWPLPDGGETSQRTRETLKSEGVLAVGFKRDPQWRFEVEVGAPARATPRLA